MDKIQTIYFFRKITSRVETENSQPFEMQKIYKSSGN